MNYKICMTWFSSHLFFELLFLVYIIIVVLLFISCFSKYQGDSGKPVRHILDKKTNKKMQILTKPILNIFKNKAKYIPAKKPSRS